VTRVSFNLKQHEQEKRKRKEEERLGIADGDEPWILPEEQQRIDEEAAERERERQEKLKAHLAEMEEQEKERRAKFKEFRAKQIAMSKKRKSASESKHSATGDTRVVIEEVDDTQENSDSGNVTPTRQH
jgi:hypothetical protein